MTHFLTGKGKGNAMNQETAEAFVIHYAQKYFSHFFPKEVLEALKTKQKTSENNQLIDNDVLFGWENKISIQSHWRGVIEDYDSGNERAIAETVKQALFKNTCLTIKHQEKQQALSFNPFGLVARNDKFYIVGCFEDDLQPCLLGADKVTQIQVTEHSALQPPKDFDLDDFSEAYLNHPTEPEIIERLTVEFPEKSFFYVKSHPIKCEKLILSEPQGTPGFFSFDAYQVKNTYLLHQWLSAFHDDAHVLEPSYIREQINRSFIDQLTNLYNRKAFDRLGSREIDRYYRDPQCYFSILVMDIDHFKNINDQHGHVFGDEVLIKVADCFRDYDAIRYGGEEFVILLPNTHANEADCAADRIRQSIESLILKDTIGDDVSVTISIGIAEFPIHLSLKDRDCLESKGKYKLDQKIKGGLMMAITAQADKALYQAKQTGRNKSVIVEGDRTL
jgi:diguanylate cyclase (GGDEF)-like protein